jgi:serine/threonine-protein kinase
MALRVRSLLGKYRLLHRIGEGGYAVVFAAFDTIEGTKVALKVPLDNAPADEVSRFRKEIRLTMKLDHPHILPIRNADEIDGRLVAAYPLGEESLDRRLHRRIARRTAFGIGEQLLDALAYAHGRRVMHRDVKPGNVILFPGNQVRLGDFGLARTVSSGTVAASGAGTLGYMAPEQALGSPSFRSDVFCVGLILYRMLAGVVPSWPFQWPLPKHAKLARTVSPEFVVFLERAIQVQHRKRFPNCAAMLVAYRRLPEIRALRK